MTTSSNTNKAFFSNTAAVRLLAPLAVLLLVHCGGDDDSNSVTCGAGTVLSNGTCVPATGGSAGAGAAGGASGNSASGGSTSGGTSGSGGIEAGPRDGDDPCPEDWWGYSGAQCLADGYCPDPDGTHSSPVYVGDDWGVCYFPNTCYAPMLHVENADRMVVRLNPLEGYIYGGGTGGCPCEADGTQLTAKYQ